MPTEAVSPLPSAVAIYPKTSITIKCECLSTRAKVVEIRFLSLSMDAKALLVVQVSRKMSVVKEMVASVEEGLHPSGIGDCLRLMLEKGSAMVLTTYLA